MESLGIYHYLNPENKDSSFEIKDMGVLYDQRKTSIHDPHRHDYYTILMVSEAKGTHKIDFNTYQLGSSQVYFVSPGQVHQVAEENRPKGSVITFSKDFLIQNGINECFIIDLNLFRGYGDSPPVQFNKEQFSLLEEHVKNMYDCFQGNSSFKLEAVSAHLKLFLIVCNDALPQPDYTNAQAYQTSIDLIRKFKLLVENHFKSNHRVGFYADQMNISSDYLNKVVKNSIGISAKDYILDRLLIAAKRELIYSSISSKEIGYNLGFSDPAYFSNFFKKLTGQSVTDYRNENRK
ncbi:MAG: helix-turn-helix domain-containing protein [Bacteroidota bacterium]